MNIFEVFFVAVKLISGITSSIMNAKRIFLPEKEHKNTTNLALPVSEASTLNFSLAKDDLKNSISYVYFSNEFDDLIDFSTEIEKLGERYGFGIRKEQGMYLWTEDNMWLSANGHFAFQPQIPLANKDQYTVFVTAVSKDLPGAEEEGFHTVESSHAQGLDKNILRQADTLVNNRNMKMFKTLSVIDGGNMLTGQRANGTAYVLVGRDALLQTTLVHSFLEKERIAVKLETAQSYQEQTENIHCKYPSDPEIDLILLEAADLIPEGLTDRHKRLEFGKFIRAKADLALDYGAITRSTDTDSDKTISPVQRQVIEERYRTLNANASEHNVLQSGVDYIKNNYNLLVAAQKLTSIYTDPLIDNKLSSWKPDSGAIDRMVIMLKKANFIRQSLGSEAAKEQAVRFLAMTEISKDIMADELNVARDDLVILSQPHFHIDMSLRPLSDGRVLLDDYQESYKLVQTVLDEQGSSITGKNREDLQQTLLNLAQLHKERHGITTLIAQQLKNAGLQVITAPGSFSVGEKKVNYMNGMLGTSKNNEMFYITNASSITALNNAFSDWLKKHNPGLNVHFVGSAAAGEGLNNAEFLLKNSGGFDCITLHHGPANNDILQLTETMSSSIPEQTILISQNDPAANNPVIKMISVKNNL